jgi:hypothetical protein
LDSAYRPRPILAVLGIFFIQLFPNWTACSAITYTYYYCYYCYPVGIWFIYIFVS